jgi:hypothetical protein
MSEESDVSTILTERMEIAGFRDTGMESGQAFCGLVDQDTLR